VDGIRQQTLTRHKRELPTCEPPYYPERTCENHVTRVITVYYGGPANTEIEWWICDGHADEVRETGKVCEDREYNENKDGYGMRLR
jgi:hypothetical protein